MTTFELSDQEAQLIDHLRAAKQQAAPEPPAEPAPHTWGAPGAQAEHEAAERTVAGLSALEISLAQNDDELDEAERLALYVIGHQALYWGFTRHTLVGEQGGEGLGWLWRETTKAIYRALPMMGQGNVDALAKKVSAGEIKID